MERHSNETLEDVTDKTDETYNRLRGRLSDANERLQDFSENAKESAVNALDHSMDWVRDNPGTAIGIALVLGAGLGVLITYWSTD